jgi:threonylcarbamoyladenosine tRNA methylthiotransferase MtaB
MIFGSKKYKVAFFTLGCKLNFAETSTIARGFEDEGYERVNFDQKADIYVINTCSVTEAANKKSRTSIKKAIKLSPNAMIIVVGCYAQLKPQEIAQIEGVDVILCQQDKFNVLDYVKELEKKENPVIQTCAIDDIENFDSSYSYGDRTRSFLKIQDGCDYKCSYCTIPLARGKSRNSSIEKIVNQAHEIAEKGMKEIILTGVNIGDFGKSTNETFFELIQELDRVPGIERYRISSIEPNLLTDDIIRFVADSKKFVPHFHIPLQSGSNRILALMKRRYKREILANRISKIKAFMPHAGIGIDVIVGFPDENEFDFIDTYNFLQDLDISYLHVFSYSERENTKAIEIKNKVHPKEKAKRSQKLHELSNLKKEKFIQSHLNTKRPVLFENHNHNGIISGFTDNYIRIQSKYNKKVANKVMLVTLNEMIDNETVSIK